MPDPFSCAANAIAILSFAVQSCHYLFEYFTKVIDAPADIQHHILLLQALQSTFCGLHGLGTDDRLRNVFIYLPPEFHRRLQHVQEDLQDVELRVRRVDEKLGRGGLSRTWARLTYAFSGDLWLKKFFMRLHTYQSTFTLDLIIFQVCGMPRIFS